MTVSNYAIVENGIVANVILWDGIETGWNPPEGSTAVKLSGGAIVDIGYIYSGMKFSAPPEAGD